MSTLDVTCGRCDKSFRVRAEFAGRATRCPGCSAPLNIGGPKVAPPPREEEPERRPRPRPKDEDDRPRKVSGNWKPVDTALAREQSALVCLLIQVGCALLAMCLGWMAGGSVGPGPFVIIPIAILMGGPALAAVVFGISARVSATGAPEDSHARGTARASLFLSFLGLGCLAFFGLAVLMAIDSTGSRHDELPMVVAVGGMIVSTLAAIGTFAGFVAQVGMARRSAAVSRSVGRLAIGATVCATIMIGIGGLYAIANAVFAPSPAHFNTRGGYYSAYPDHSDFYRITVFGLFPVSLVVLLVLYHRLLAAARRSVQREDV